MFKSMMTQMQINVSIKLKHHQSLHVGGIRPSAHNRTTTIRKYHMMNDFIHWEGQRCSG